MSRRTVPAAPIPVIAERADGSVDTSPLPPVLVAHDPARVLAEPIDLGDLFVSLWRRKLFIVVGALLGFVIAALYLHRAPVRYTAVLEVTSASLGPRGANGGAASALGTFASLAGVTGSSAASTFDLYIATLTSRAAADDLARDPAIMRAVFAPERDPAGGWREPPHGMLGAVRRGVFDLFGIPVQPWHAPDAARLQDFLAHALVLGRDTANSPITNIAFTDADPRFAADLLNRVSAVADDHVRRAELARARSYIAYLQVKLATVTLAEQRSAIAAILADQERQAMTASSSLSYAAQAIEPAAVPASPSGTPPVLILLGLTFVGAVLGALLALVDWRAVRAKFRRRRA